MTRSTLEYDSAVCLSCRHSRGIMRGWCKKASRHIESPEGAILCEVVPCDIALNRYRKTNAGRCPYYRKRLRYRIKELLGI